MEIKDITTYLQGRFGEQTQVNPPDAWQVEAADFRLLWGVFQDERASLTEPRLEAAISRVLVMKQEGVSPFFNTLIEQQIRQIIAVAKQQGQSLEATLQTLDRFYSEGMMGDMADSDYQGQALEAWQRQLERLWTEAA